MQITGKVAKVIRRKTDHGSSYITLDIDRGEGGIARMRYLHGFEKIPVKGQSVTLEGMAMVGFPRVNVGGVKLTVHE